VVEINDHEIVLKHQEAEILRKFGTHWPMTGSLCGECHETYGRHMGDECPEEHDGDTTRQALQELLQAAEDSLRDAEAYGIVCHAASPSINARCQTLRNTIKSAKKFA